MVALIYVCPVFALASERTFPLHRLIVIIYVYVCGCVSLILTATPVSLRLLDDRTLPPAHDQHPTPI